MSLKKIDDSTLDLGSIVSIVVGSASLSAIGKGIEAWLAKRHDSKITIKKDGDVIAENVSSEDAVALAKMFKN